MFSVLASTCSEVLSVDVSDVGCVSAYCLSSVSDAPSGKVCCVTCKLSLNTCKIVYDRYRLNEQAEFNVYYG